MSVAACSAMELGGQSSSGTRSLLPSRRSGALRMPLIPPGHFLSNMDEVFGPHRTIRGHDGNLNLQYTQPLRLQTV